VVLNFIETMIDFIGKLNIQHSHIKKIIIFNHTQQLKHHYQIKSMDTAVIWLQKALGLHLTEEQMQQFEGLFQQAIDMERNQIITAYVDGNKMTRPFLENSEGFYYYYKYNQEFSDWDVTLMDGLEDEPIEPF